MTFIAGARIGQYEIVAVLGQGGMGVVYRAIDTKLQRPVAVKFLSEDIADPSARRRFQREAQMASALNHPHILTVYDIGELEGRQYLVTEFIDDGTLKEWAHAERRTSRQIVDLLTGVADGLAAAHAAGILHRDVKPENVLVAKNGYAKLADFGLAKLLENADPNAPTGEQTMTGTRRGVLMGTIAYMSPEQIDGKAVDERSDIFSFGTVLYELLVGRHPFSGGTAIETLERIQHQATTLIGGDVPPALCAIVDKALEKDPAERYQSMREMVVDLRRATRTDWRDTPAARASGHRDGRSRVRGHARGRRIRSLAVLPLQNLSRDPDQEFFSDGTTEALISNLAQIRSLDVISRTTVMRYKGTTKTIPEVGRELSVDAVLEGSIQRVGSRVRISVQLIRTSTDTHLWANDYDRDLADVLKLEADVARTVAQEIQAHLTPEVAGRLASTPTVSPEAREAFLLGRYHQVKDNLPDLQRAIEYYAEAIRIQPDYAAAYAWLSYTSFALRNSGLAKEEGVMRAAATKALELNPNLAEAHHAMAWIKLTDWDWAGAEHEARRALALNPDVRSNLPYLLCITARHAEAIALFAHAAKVDPLSSQMQFDYGATLYFARRYGDALPRLKRAIELEPRNYAAMIILGATYQALGQWHEMLSIFEHVEFRESPYLARSYALVGRRADALELLNRVIERGGAFDVQEVALTYFALGDRNRGFEWLTRAFDQRAGYLPWAKVNPLFDDVRSDPRFEELVARLKLPP